MSASPVYNLHRACASMYKRASLVPRVVDPSKRSVEFQNVAYQASKLLYRDKTHSLNLGDCPVICVELN